jgi:hypothetical protein
MPWIVYFDVILPHGWMAVRRPFDGHQTATPLKDPDLKNKRMVSACIILPDCVMQTYDVIVYACRRTTSARFTNIVCWRGIFSPSSWARLWRRPTRRKSRAGDKKRIKTKEELTVGLLERKSNRTVDYTPNSRRLFATLTQDHRYK